MESNTDRTPIVVIVGPTGSGKTSLAIDMAQRFNGEIICADSRTLYKGMDIGTAKPTKDERNRVVHHLLDITTPDQPITVADFKNLAVRAIHDIHARKRVPFLVGGSGLYIDAVIFDFSFRGEPNLALRKDLELLPLEVLHSKVLEQGLQLPNNAENRRHVIRLLEAGDTKSGNYTLREDTLLLGVAVAREELEARIATRLELMFQGGLERETRNLIETYGWECPALQTIGYQEFKPYFQGQCTLDEVRLHILCHSLQYAKRQKTWFKRNKSILYPSRLEEYVELITTFLNKKL